MKGLSQENTTISGHIQTQLNGATVRELDKWRAEMNPRPSRSEAARLLLEERFSTGRQAKKERQLAGVRPDAERLGALYALERVPGFGPAKFRALHEAGIDPQAAIESPDIAAFQRTDGRKATAGNR